MDIRTSQLDMSDPFAQVKQRLMQAETLVQQMPPSQRRALMAATLSFRQSGVRQPVPLAWQWWVAGVRLRRRIKKQWQRQARLLKRKFRLLARQALHHHNHLRGR